MSDIKIPQVEVVTRWEGQNKPELFMVNGKEVMTGQEWYDRFIIHIPTDQYNQIYLDAAKRAIGLPEQN